MTRSGDHTPDLHIPVLLGPVMDALCPAHGEVFVDGTFGAGGYTKALLDTAPCKVIAIDRDPNAISAGAWLVESCADRLTLVQGRFSQMEQIVADAGLPHVDGIVLDVGVSSMQLDQGERGFSFMRDGPLDMRMEQQGTSAADVVNNFEERDLRHIIGALGEEKRAFAIAKAIQGIAGTIKNVQKIHSDPRGSLLVEVSTFAQSMDLLKTQLLANVPAICFPHVSLNQSKGVIRTRDLDGMDEIAILDALRPQGVTLV
jgi:16S rRNA (cytosine(1402)-N(4))-methyltransferase